MINPSAILFQVLAIIDYEDDKASFVDSFLYLCYQKASDEYLANLPQATQDKLHTLLAHTTTHQAIQEALHPYVDMSAYTTTLFQTTQDLFADYITSITPTLTKSQRDDLNTYLVRLSSKNTPSNPLIAEAA